MKSLLKSAAVVSLVVIVLLTGLAVTVVRRTCDMMADEAELTVRHVVRETAGKIDKHLLAVEAAVRNLAWVVGEHLDAPDSMFLITRALVENNDAVIGSTVAFQPGFFKQKGRLFAPYTCVTTNGLQKSFPLPYDYLEREWYGEVLKSGRANWCEPYFDQGGGGVAMCTYSVPVRDAKGRIYAVLTADVALAEISEYVKTICPYPKSYAVMISPAGRYLVLPPQGRTLERDGKRTITIREKTVNGWVVSIVCPLEDILAGARKTGAIVFAFAGFGLMIVIVIVLAWSPRRTGLADGSGGGKSA